MRRCCPAGCSGSTQAPPTAPDAGHPWRSTHSGTVQRRRARFPAPARQNRQSVFPAKPGAGPACGHFLRNSGWHAAPRGRRRRCAAGAVLPKNRFPAPDPTPCRPGRPPQPPSPAGWPRTPRSARCGCPGCRSRTGSCRAAAGRLRGSFPPAGRPGLRSRQK